MRRPSLSSLPLSSASLAVLTALLLLPVLMVLASWLQWSSDSAAILREMVNTVLPDYALTSVLLCLLVGVGVVVLGSGMRSKNGVAVGMRIGAAGASAKPAR